MTEIIETSPEYAYNLNERLESSWGRSVESNWEAIGEAEMDGDLSYEFDTVRAWRHKSTGAVVIAHDSGCSCPMPFEDTTVADVTFVHRLVDFDEFVDQHVKKATRRWDRETYSYITLPEPQADPSVVDGVYGLRQAVEAALVRA